jgi:hypothetical protein
VLQLGVPVDGQALERDIGVETSEPTITQYPRGARGPWKTPTMPSAAAAANMNG